MKTDHKNSLTQISAAALRQRAEDLLGSKLSDSCDPLTEHDSLRVVHELQVYQIELEMQVAELRQAYDDLSASEERYRQLKAYREHNPDIVITDINMPIMNGLAILHEISTLDNNRLVPAICIQTPLRNRAYQ
jgi:CheY-like chemotaxis protein